MILCIDDEVIGLRVRQILLQREGYEVLTASSGREGIELFAANPVKAVVLDYAMPEMDGAQVAEELKRLNPAAKILLLSAYVDLPEAALKWVDGRAVKGIAPTSFLTELRQLLSCEIPPTVDSGLTEAAAECTEYSLPEVD
jgi:CheY-like chemotaxis protein